MEQANTTDRDYSSISPSAKSLLMMKGLTPIPYAREAAALMIAPEPYVPDYSNKHPLFWARVAHFETRYQSISILLRNDPVKQILELSSGFSFRGLDWVHQQDVHYIDTDLPEVVRQKNTFVQQLEQEAAPRKGLLEILPLNALDEQQFQEVISHFESGPLAMVNEGLLMYLGIAEKEQLCRIIHRILKERGGYWVTADIYLKPAAGTPSLRIDDQLQQFLEQHHVEDNMFDSIDQARSFFQANGFIIDEEAQPDYSQASALKYLLENITEEQQQKMKNGGRIHTTWKLKAA